MENSQSDQEDSLDENVSLSPSNWMNINEASHFVRYAIACYSWPYYIYRGSIKGVTDLKCSRSIFCCCQGGESAENTSHETQNVAEAEVKAARIEYGLVHGDPSRNHMRAFKILASIDDCDVVYANFNNEICFAPFCILIDHKKKTVVIAIRGTLSMR